MGTPTAPIPTIPEFCPSRAVPPEARASGEFDPKPHLRDHPRLRSRTRTTRFPRGRSSLSRIERTEPSPEKTLASRPFDVDRNGIVVAEGGAICTLERLPDALARGATIYGEIVGHAMNSDATDFVLPDATRQAECIRLALGRAGISPEDIDILSSHATATDQGDIEECRAIREVFGDRESLAVNNAKSFIGHAWGRLELWSWLATCLPSKTKSHTLQSTSIDWIPSAVFLRLSPTRPGRWIELITF